MKPKTAGINTRRLRSTITALAFITALLGVNEQVQAQTATRTAKRPNGIQASFDHIKQIKAGVLDIGYAEVGAAKGEPVILLHGWPYDIHSYTEVSTLLAAKGYRVLVPYAHHTLQAASAIIFRRKRQKLLLTLL
jgi:hypothetical protein